jgi:hypothetical protein
MVCKTIRSPVAECAIKQLAKSEILPRSMYIGYSFVACHE